MQILLPEVASPVLVSYLIIGAASIAMNAEEIDRNNNW
jgi:hypothetical protein